MCSSHSSPITYNDVIRNHSLAVWGVSCGYCSCHIKYKGVNILLDIVTLYNIVNYSSKLIQKTRFWLLACLLQIKLTSQEGTV